jgi:hypothetical protein
MSGKPLTLNQKNSASVYYDQPDRNGRLEEHTLYIPEASNEKSLDAFFKHKSCLYILQFTIADTHSIKGGFESFFSSYAECPPSNDWKFVFITDGSQTLNVPVPRNPYPFTLYSALEIDGNRMTLHHLIVVQKSILTRALLFGSRYADAVIIRPMYVSQLCPSAKQTKLGICNRTGEISISS